MNVANDFPWIPQAYTSGVDDGDVENDPLWPNSISYSFSLPINILKNLNLNLNYNNTHKHQMIATSPYNKFTRPTQIIQQVYQ